MYSAPLTVEHVAAIILYPCKKGNEWISKHIQVAFTRPQNTSSLQVMMIVVDLFRNEAHSFRSLT